MTTNQAGDGAFDDTGWTGAAQPPSVPPLRSMQRGLLSWLAVIVGGSLVSVLLGHVEAAVFLAGAGLFALAQASDAAAALDAYRDWVRGTLPRASAAGTLTRMLVRGVVPLGGAVVYLGIATYARTAGSEPNHVWAMRWCMGAVVVSLALIARPVADGLVRVMFRVEGPVTRTLRLTARLAVLALMLVVPARLLAADLLAFMRESPTPMVDAGSLAAQLAGELALALAGVGLWVKRGARETAQRLGLGGMRLRHWLIAALGLAAAIALNSGMERLQHAFFPSLWNADTEMTRLIAGHLTPATALLLGISAGVGEEVLVRGALQPRVGLFWASLIFASGHVQYTWFGMLTIGLLGLLLGTVRQRANTTTAIVVHALYDVFAAMTSH